MKNGLIFTLLLALLIMCIPLLSLGKNKKTDKIESSLSSPEHKSVTFLMLDLSQNKVISADEKDFLIGAVACEMPLSYHKEALKAQAVSTYTYSIRLKKQQEQKKSEELLGAYFTVDTKNYVGYATKDQLKERFGSNFDLYYKKLDEAVNEVLGQIMTYESEPILAAYHAISNGKTETSKNTWGSDLPYLQPADSQGDKICADYESKVTVPKNELTTSLKSKFPDIVFPEDLSRLFENTEKSSSGTILTVTIGDTKIKGSEIRELFKLRSPTFSVQFKDDSFIFTVLGYGHGVGMSQNGADFMARQGSSYKEILAHYYNGAELGVLL